MAEEDRVGGAPAAAARKRDQVVTTLHAMLAEWSDGPPDWENTTLPRYLEALAAWLQDCEGAYMNAGEPFPDDGREVMNEALQAAMIYE